MYEELKSSLIPVSEQIASAKEHLHITQQIRLIGIIFIVVALIVFIVVNHFRYGCYTAMVEAKAFGVLMAIVGVSFCAYSLASTLSYKVEIARLSKYNLENQPYLNYIENHYKKVDKKTVTSLKSNSKTDFAFLWSGSDSTITAYITSKEYLEVITITPKENHHSDMLTLFVVYKDENKVILKSEDGEIGMSIKEYKQLRGSQKEE